MADMYLFPSLREGGSWALMEAMAAELPVVCFDWTGTGVITDDLCANRIKPTSMKQDVDCFADAVEDLINNPEKRVAYGVHARERILNVYNWDTKGRFMDKLFDDSCGGYCKGRVRSRQQFTAERADERSTNSMNITYTRNGDYLIPNIIIRKTKPIGHYGRLRKAYLEMHRPILFNELVLSDKLFEHCAEIDEAARSRMELIVPELAKQYGVTEQLKAENQMEWVWQMNACKAQAEEVVKAELIYN